MRKTLVVAAAAVLVAGSAWATPIFTGDPYADFGTGATGLPPVPQPGDTWQEGQAPGPGYYVWANDAERTSWSVRWTGGFWKDGTEEYFSSTEGDLVVASSAATYDWWGTISYQYSASDGGIQTLDLVSWDGGDGLLIWDPELVWLSKSDPAAAGRYWDGFDFSLSGDVGDYLTLTLRSDYFSSSDYMDDANKGVYVGQDLMSVPENSDNPALFAVGESRQFEVAAPVPEPTTMLLLGSGLIGIAGVSRRKRTKS